MSDIDELEQIAALARGDVEYSKRSVTSRKNLRAAFAKGVETTKARSQDPDCLVLSVYQPSLAKLKFMGDA